MGDGYEPSGDPDFAEVLAELDRESRANTLLRDENERLRAENARLRDALETIAAEPVTRCNGYSRCTDMFVGAHVPLTARAALLSARGEA